MDQKLNYLLDKSIPFDGEKVRLLDNLTQVIQSNSPEAKEAHEIWRLLREDDYFWYNSDKVLQLSALHDTKVFILVILEQAIKQKWFALPEDQRNNLKAYIVNIVLDYGAKQNLSKQLHNILSKANSILVQIVKYEWNTTWTSFINDICSASKTDMNLCENNFSILKMLSEQIFDYSKNQMTQKQIAQLKAQMVKDFTTIYQLCNLILQNLGQAKQSLIKACLETLHAFLSWIPMYYIIYTDLIEKLGSLLSEDYLRNSALSCLVQISSLTIDSSNTDERNKFLLMLKNTTIQLHKILPLAHDQNELARLHNNVKRKWHIFEVLARGISNFYSEFFKQHALWVQIAIDGNPDLIDAFRFGFSYLTMLMKIDDDQVFKICIQFFHFYIGRYLDRRAPPEINRMGLISNQSACLQSIYNDIFLDVMKIIARKMAKPEEVLIVIDEDGFPVREEIENTENSSLYEIMKQLATFLVKYDWPSMKNFILKDIDSQNQNFSYDAINSLSWIVGSLCGSILEKEEKNFFISTLRTLLHLCQLKKGKQNKAVIASCIMYVVGQYPTFLRNNWSFLRTVIRKLFEFMKEDFPGIMEMACNSFLKIVKSTADQFVMLQHGEQEPFAKQIIRRIPQQTSKLHSDSLRLIFYEAVGYLIGAQKMAPVQIEMMKQAQGVYLYEFQNIIQQAKQQLQIMEHEQVKGKILYFLKINEMFATGIGQQYALLLQELSSTFNNLYMFYSNKVNEIVRQKGKNMLNYMTVKLMRSIKKQVIKIYIKFLQKCDNLNQEQAFYILETFIFPLGSLLKDFQSCIPQTKQQQFVALFTVVLEKLCHVLTPEFLSNLLSMIFASSLPLITTDFNSFPEIRANFFFFLKALIKYNFNMLYSLEQSHFTTILHCVIWSLRHELPNYSDLGLDLLEQMLISVNRQKFIMNAFYPKYYLEVLTEILSVMTDGFHKSGLEVQSKIFYILISIITQNMVSEPISQNQEQSNPDFLFNFLVQRLSTHSPNTNQNIIIEKVKSWFHQLEQQQFKLQVADYLVLINRYTPQELVQSKAQ